MKYLSRRAGLQRYKKCVMPAGRESVYIVMNYSQYGLTLQRKHIAPLDVQSCIDAIKHTEGNQGIFSVRVVGN